MNQAFSLKEASTIIGVGTTKLYSLINAGELKARKIGKLTVILKSDLDDFLSNLEPYASKSGVRNDV